LTVREETAGQAGDRLVFGTFRHDIDVAADDTAGRLAVQQRAWSFQHLDTLGHFDRDTVVREDAVHAV
jgi:hypothetical protein